MTCDRPTAFARPYSRLAPAYDAVVGVRDFLRTRARFEAIVRRHGIRFLSAVDLGCGTGLFACWLHRRFGVPVLGVDRSPRMLEMARRNCGCEVRFVQQDIRRLRLPAPVDLATANTLTLSHLMTGAELRDVFRRIRDALRPAGHLIFDVLSDRQPWDPAQALLVWLGGPARRMLQSIRWDDDRKVLAMDILHLEAPDRTVERYLGRGYPLRCIGRWLRASGLLLLACYRSGIAPSCWTVVAQRR
jgi:SAM-dependent methyltransferase